MMSGMAEATVGFESLSILLADVADSVWRREPHLCRRC